MAAASACQSNLDEESRRWIEGLTGDDSASAATQLHELLLRVARREVRRRNTGWRITGPELDDLAFQAAADALMGILDKVDRFRGDSRFTTWACKFVIFEVSKKLGRHYWQRHGTVCDAEHWDRLPDRFGIDPAQESEAGDLMAALRRAVDETLTDHQRRVFVALVVNGLPVDALTIELGSTRNALYKTMFDARRRLRAALQVAGYLGLDVGNE